MVEIPTKNKEIVDGDFEACLRFENSKGRIRYDRNNPELVEQGIKKWFLKEMRI